MMRFSFFTIKVTGFIPPNTVSKKLISVYKLEFLLISSVKKLLTLKLLNAKKDRTKKDASSIYE